MTFKTAALTACVFLCAHATRAQDMKKPVSAGLGFELGPTAGVTKTDFSGMFGPTTWLAFRAGHGFLSLTTGFLLFVPVSTSADKSDASFQIPVLAGYKYIFMHERLFVKGELGASHFTHTFHDSREAEPVPSWTSWGPTLALSAGYQFNPMELSLKDEIFPSSGLGIHYYAFQLGFDF
ncbi:MAG TPA: hypothetical protein VL978_04080 [Puia sp.]|nr:hypothetical protein [Puia sp.]